MDISDSTIKRKQPVFQLHQHERMDIKSAAVVLANLSADRDSSQLCADPWICCVYCDRTLPSSELYEHVAAHIDYSPLACGHCLCMFSTRPLLVRHTARLHPGLPIKVIQYH